MLTNFPTLKAFSHGDYVRLAQSALNLIPNSGLPELKIDGIYGPKSWQRVAEFQKSRGLVPDQITGSKTWLELARPISIVNGVFDLTPYGTAVTNLSRTQINHPDLGSSHFELGSSQALAKTGDTSKSAAPPASLSSDTGFRVTDIGSTVLPLAGWLKYVKKAPGIGKLAGFIVTGGGYVELKHSSGKKYTMGGFGGGINASFSPIDWAPHAKGGGHVVKFFFKKFGISLASGATGTVYKMPHVKRRLEIWDLSRAWTTFHSISADWGVGGGFHLVLFGADPIFNFAHAAGNLFLSDAYALVAAGKVKIKPPSTGVQVSAFKLTTRAST